MSGASELSNLLATLEPELSASEVVFCHFPGVSFEDKPPFRSLGAFDEREGLTLIVSRSEAEMHGLPFETVLRAITLNVHSSLEAVASQPQSPEGSPSMGSAPILCRVSPRPRFRPSSRCGACARDPSDAASRSVDWPSRCGRNTLRRASGRNIHRRIRSSS